jgi:hypothetical protein
MKINISRQYIYLLAISVFLLIVVLVFSFAVLIPKGKDYRKDRIELKKETNELRKYQDFHSVTQEKLKTLQSDNRRIISAFDAIFNPDRFEKQFRSHFMFLKLSKLEHKGQEDDFELYEVNTSSHISSPKSFYNFLDAVNKSDWIIGVNFPINFKRDGELILSSFTMKVYANPQDTNTSKAKATKTEEN